MIDEDFIKGLCLDGEKWMEYPNGDGFYFASTFGRILSVKKGRPRLLKQVLYNERHKSYYAVCLYINGKGQRIRVHRVIALTFLDNPNGYHEVDHINGDSLDNRVQNLRWCSHTENMRNPTTKARLRKSHKEAQSWYSRIPGTHAKIKKPVVQLRNGEVVKIFPGIIDTRKDGFCAENVGQVCRGRCTTHRGYQWAYLEDYEKSISSSTSQG